MFQSMITLTLTSFVIVLIAVLFSPNIPAPEGPVILLSSFVGGLAAFIALVFKDD